MNLAISIYCLVFHVFIFRIYLTLVKAVTLILKHATFLQISISSKSALTSAELSYQKANVDVAIQQHLTACALEQSVEQFVGFIMSTDILWCGTLQLFHIMICQHFHNWWVSWCWEMKLWFEECSGDADNERWFFKAGMACNVTSNVIELGMK